MCLNRTYKIGLSVEHLTKMWWRDSWKSIPVFSIGPELQCWLSQCSLWLIRILLFSLLSCAWLFATPWTAAWQAFLSSTIIWSLLKLVSIESVMLSNHLILCHPLFLLPSIFLSIWVFSTLHQGAQVLEFSFSISPPSEYSGLISLKIDWFDLLAVQGTFRSLYGSLPCGKEAYITQWSSELCCAGPRKMDRS